MGALPTRGLITCLNSNTTDAFISAPQRPFHYRILETFLHTSRSLWTTCNSHESPMIFWCKHLDPRLLAIRMVIGGRKLGSLEIGSKTVIFFIPSYALCLVSWKQHPTILAQTPRSPYRLIEPNLAPLAHRTWRRKWLSLGSLLFFFRMP